MAPNFSSYLAALGIFFVLAQSGIALEANVRNLTIPMGVVEGRSCPLVPGVTAFLGIPYALPPTDELRFRPPVVYDQDYPDGIWNATEYGDVCGTPCDGSGNPDVRKTIGEDCLYLNIWVPLNASNWGDLAVRVYIHGGMNTACTGNDAHIDGCFSAQATQSITVNLNYRLGSPGFLAHPQTLVESNTTGNWALLDHQAALTWIQTYIHYFGGNASKVLIYGGSSGGSLVSLHTTLEGSAGLFNAAVSESATCYEALTLEESYKLTDSISATVGCPADRSAEDLACLRSLSMELLSNSVPDASTQMNCYDHTRTPVFAPVIDGTVLKEQLVEAMAAGRFNKVPFMVGTNKNEGNFFIEHIFPDVFFSVTEEDLVAFLETIYLDANITKLIQLFPLEAYAGETYPGYARFSEVLTDLFVRCPGYRMLNARSSFQEVPLYSFFFSHTPSCPVSSTYQGCTHGSELMFVFGNTINVYPPTGTCNYNEPEDKLSDAFMYAWTQMAQSGIPQLQYGAQFPYWTQIEQNTTVLDLNITFGTVDITSRCAAFQEIVAEAVKAGKPINERLKSTYSSVAFA